MRCAVCAGERFQGLPDPHAQRSMASDFRVLNRPLGKLQCERCGLVRSRYAQEDASALYGSEDYSLYAHEAAGDAEEAQRQERYASWIAELLPPLDSIYEAGAGNGSLLAALSRRYPHARLSGVEPSPMAAEFARGAGLDVCTGFLETAAACAGAAIAVNVIEHTPDPLRFISDLAGNARDAVLVICPDASRASSELLVADHVHSFAPVHMRTLFERRGLSVTAQRRAPEELGAFFATIATNGPVSPSTCAAGPAQAENFAYLQRWSQLDQTLLSRLPPGETACFGAGEAAALLRAYAPESWKRVTACYVDNPAAARFGELWTYWRRSSRRGRCFWGCAPPRRPRSPCGWKAAATASFGGMTSCRDEAGTWPLPGVTGCRA